MIEGVFDDDELLEMTEKGRRLRVGVGMRTKEKASDV